jgi:hypothetical protein
VRPRVLAVAWAVVIVGFVVLLLVEVNKYRSITNELNLVTTERQRLTAEIELRQQQILLELRNQAPLLQEMQWTLGGADPSAFLTSMAALAKEKRLTIMSIGPLEHRATPQFTKSWHTIQVRAPFREIEELVGRIEQDRGILEGVRIQPVPAPAPSGQTEGAAAPAEIQASFNLASVEISPQGKQIIERAMAATGAGKTAALPGSPPALPVPSAAQLKLSARDPFAFLTPPTPARPPATASASPQAPAGPPPEFALKGIVSFPDGFLAIVNDQIVKVGDTVSGYKVDRITENSVTLSVQGATPRTIELPELSPAPAPRGAPRR